jgi:fumarylacetoacetate (FAA) hydrolase
MKLASLRDGSRDGRLAVVSRDLSRACLAPVPTMLALMDQWVAQEPVLRRVYQALNEGKLESFAFDPGQAMAPLPRSFQWLDASAFLAHGALMTRALRLEKNVQGDVPLIYQGGSDSLLGPCEDVPFPSEGLGIDFEGEFAVCLGDVPMGATQEEAEQAIRLLTIANDWSLRTLAVREMATGFGWLQCKPSTSFAPVAITPDELGPAWDQGRVKLRLSVSLNGALFGKPDGAAMDYGFPELICHAARTRRLCAGTLLGSGTVSEGAPQRVGSACIAEMRGGEMILHGEPRTAFLKFGDEVAMTAYDAEGHAPFGALSQRVVAAQRQEIP